MLPAATPLLSFEMNVARDGGHVQGILTMAPVAALTPSQDPFWRAPGFVFVTTPNCGTSESAMAPVVEFEILAARMRLMGGLGAGTALMVTARARRKRAEKDFMMPATGEFREQW